MGDTTKDLHLKYINKCVVHEIVNKLENETLVSHEATSSNGLDGFMSALYTIKLQTKSESGTKIHLFIAKFLKGDVNFRESSRSYIQFENEVFTYAQVLPEYKKLLQATNSLNISTDDWVPRAYVAKFGYIEELSASPTERESLLVLENLIPYGYTLGPRSFLRRDHLLSMCKPLAQFHAVGHALRLVDPTVFNRLKNEILTLHFINDNDPNDAQNNVYRVMYRIAFDRIFEFFYRCVDTGDKQQSEDDLKLIKALRNLRKKYFDEPTRLMERFCTQIEDSEEDRRFATILHGDYNRNNVLFRYGTNDGEIGEVADAKMVDFQQLRYGSPAIDLSFFMFMNTPGDIRANVWMDILREYHAHMHQTLAAVLKARNYSKQKITQILEDYNFANFNAHFGRYAFYGVMITLNFLPWMLCSAEKCAEISHLFATDMHGEAFHRVVTKAGGEEINFILLDVLKHACKMGYMDYI